MTIRPLVILPDAQLRQRSAALEGPSAALDALVKDMFETMYDAPGIGLAAIQIGVPQRVVTLDVSKRDDTQEPMALINPEIFWHSEEESEFEEGCLSIPDYFEIVTRPAVIRLRYRDLKWKLHEIEADEVLATCIQHEVDHLNGVLFIDHISKLKRDRVIRKFTKLAREREG